MPLDDATAKKANVSNAYPWFNFHSFTLDDGVELSATAPTLEEVLASLSNRIEAEDTTYVTYDSKGAYSAQTNQTDYSNSGGAGGVFKGSIVYTYDEIVEYTDVNKYAPYVQYAVKVSEAGDYAIRLGAFNGCTYQTCVAVLVNGQAYEAKYPDTWVVTASELIVSLKAGINYIRVSAPTKDFIDSLPSEKGCYVNHDYLDIQKCVTPVLKADLPGATTVNAWDATNVLTKNFKTITVGTEVGDADRNGMKNNRVSLETALNYLDVLTYTALKVNAESDGYYA